MGKSKEYMKEIGKENEDYENAVKEKDKFVESRKKLRNSISAIESRIRQKEDEHDKKKEIEKRHLNLLDNVKVLSKKLTTEKKKEIMASLGKKDGMQDHMRSVGETGKDSMKARQIMSEEEGKIDERFE